MACITQNRKCLCIAAAGVALAGSAAAPVRADHALVVGVNRYVHLPPTAQLAGSDNDAAAIGRKLTALGFTVTILTDAQATRQGILEALGRVRSQNGPHERFVFYFAGHGAKSPGGSGVILPSDADPSAKDSVLGRDDLYAAVTAVPASSRTVLLDSCFSGAMGRAFDLDKGAHPARKSRFYNFYAMPKRLVLVSKVSAGDEPAAADPAAASGRVCYFLAAKPYQQAYEDDLDGRQDGLFTYYLVKRLKSTQEPWRDIQTDVTGSVMGSSIESQTPVLTRGFADKVVFGGEEEPAPRGPDSPEGTSQSLWDEFNRSHDDPAQIRLEMDPDSSTVAIGQKFTFKVTPGSDGYLVVMELDTDGSLNLIYPSSQSEAGVPVHAGTAVTLPSDPTKAWTVDKEGTEAVRAILFRSREAAQHLLAAFPPDRVVTSWLQAKDRKILMTEAAPFYTASLGFEVSRQPLGAGD